MFYILAAALSTIDPVELHETCREIEEEPHFHMVRNLLTQHPNHSIARNWECLRRSNFHFSHEVSPSLPVTNQRASGRCWIFGSLNVLRNDLCKKLSIADFEFSESYLFFHDKIEKANLFLERIIETGHEPVNSDNIRFLLSRVVEDGGSWHCVVDLIEKYGLVPKSVYPENEACNLSLQLNKILNMVLIKDAEILRNCLARGEDLESVRREKQKLLREVYQVLVTHMGAPPKTFDFSYYDKDKTLHVIKHLTPKTFAEEFIDIPLDDYVYLVNSPRKETPYYRTLLVSHSKNMAGGRDYQALNLPIDEIKAVVKAVLLADRPVSFAADVHHQTDRHNGLFDRELYDFENLYQIDFSMTKSSRLAYRLSVPNHLMAFTGVHLENELPIRWKVENSWGSDVGKQGFFSMTDSWFDEYVFDVTVPRKFLPEDLKALLHSEPIVLEPWDPLWALSD